MYLLGIDLETGGPMDCPIEENWITEIGAVLWHVEEKRPVVILNEIIDMGKGISPDVSEFTGITQKDFLFGLTANTPPMREFVHRLNYLAFNSDAIVAHNGTKFDKPLLLKFIDEQRPDCGVGHSLNTLPWIDTLVDVAYPKYCKKNLTELAAYHKVFNFFTHRASQDVLTMLQVLSNYDINTVLENAKSPLLEVQARFSYPNRRDYAKGADYANAMFEFNIVKAKVSKAGFRWEPERKVWSLLTKERMLPEFDFPTVVVKC